MGYISSDHEWKEVKTPYEGYPYKVTFVWRTGDTLANISKWCEDNCTGKYQYQYTNTVFHFEKSEDAMMLELMLPRLDG